MVVVKMRRKLIAGFMLSAAALCLVVAIVSFIYSWNFISHAARATGQVTSLTERSGNYYPVVSFDDAGGDHHTLYSSMGSSPPGYQVGDRVTILYAPGNPANARIDSFLSTWIIPLVMGTLAMSYILLGLIIWFWPQIAGLIATRSR
jgi:hypothetical protein